jgi:hypothetical protein
MQLTGHGSRTQLTLWAKALHIFYAGLYAFVLPLICWGAQATPGHPHARAHFVFMDPVLVTATHAAADHGLPTAAVSSSLQAWLLNNNAASLCHTPLSADAAAELPVGRSAPAQLAIGSFLLLGQVLLVVPANTGAGFYHGLAQRFAEPFSPPIPTPPPR